MSAWRGYKGRQEGHPRAVTETNIRRGCRGRGRNRMASYEGRGGHPRAAVIVTESPGRRVGRREYRDHGGVLPGARAGRGPRDS